MQNEKNNNGVIMGDLRYYCPLYDNSQYGQIVYSCDMLRLKFTCFIQDFQKLMNNLCFDNVNYKYYESFGYFKYRHIWVVDIGLSTLTIGYSLNNYKSKYDGDVGFVEFNPNKCIIDNKFFDFYNRLSYCFKTCDIASYDIAVDLPIKRKYCCINRENQKTYTTISKDFELNDLTEYLGLIHSNGTIKLYNKTIESKLDYDLTRFEFTYNSLKKRDIQKLLVVVRIDNSYSMSLISDLSINDKILLNYLLNDKNFNSNFYQLSYRKRVKLEPYINKAKTILNINIDNIMSVLKNMQNIFEKNIYTKVAKKRYNI